MIIRPLQWQELSQADRVFRLAFGTAANLSDPLQIFGDAGYMHRWYLSTGCAIAAEENGQIVATNFLVRWGSLGLFGPLTVHPNHWNQGIASALMTATMAKFDQWQQLPFLLRLIVLNIYGSTASLGFLPATSQQ